MQLLPNTEYITSIGWIPERPGQIGVRVLPRLQQIETLLVNNASSGLTLASLVTQNMTGGWVESRPYSVVWIDANRFVDIRAHDDFYHVALMSLIEPDEVVFLTSGQFAVTAIAGYEHSTSSVYFFSTEAGATTRNLYSVTLHGKVERITHQHITGTKYNSAYWGPGDIYVLEGSSADTPTKQWVVPRKTAFTTQHVLSENQWLVDKLASYNVPSKVFTTVTGANGDELNAYLIHPHGAIDGILYPVLFTFYQGPTSARVLDMWSLGFNEWISTRSKVIVVVIDGAGTAGRSISFNQQIYLRLGVKETADQLAAITGLLKKRRDMDWNRVAVWGWSYGGFMTLNLALNSNGVFNGAISVAPVTDWRLYDTFYTERYMQTPTTNEAGYNETSILRLVDTNAASRLSIEMQNRTHLYLVHGLADDNVHFQNSAEFVQRMVANDVPLSMAYYPNQDHSISRDGSLLHLYHGIRYFLKSNVIDFLFYDLHPDS
jgi:dipeptidyl-peptidase-4